MNQVFIRSTIIVLFSVSAFAAETPESYSYRQGQGAARPVAPKATSAQPAVSQSAAYQRPEMPTSGINRFRYVKGSAPEAIRSRPMPEGCGFMSGTFGLTECRRKTDGSMECAGNYTNPVESGLMGLGRFSPFSDQGKSTGNYFFSVTDTATLAFLCATHSDPSKNFNRPGSAVVANETISKGLQICDPSKRLFSGGEVNSRVFKRLAGPALADAMKTQATTFMARQKGKTAEDVLLACAGPDSKTPPQLPVEQSPLLPIPPGGPSDTARPKDVSAPAAPAPAPAVAPAPAKPAAQPAAAPNRVQLPAPLPIPQGQGTK